jgi:adenylosuccinate synthase
MQKKAFIVVGLGFGDEGKGLSTDFLCSHHLNSLVIRFMEDIKRGIQWY